MLTDNNSGGSKTFGQSAPVTASRLVPFRRLQYRYNITITITI